MKLKFKIILVLLILSIVVFLMFICQNATEGVVLAFAAVGIPITGETPTVSKGEENTEELFKEDISTAVTQMMPARTPVDTIIRNLKKTNKVGSQKVGYYQASYKPINDTLSSEASGDGTNASSACKSYTYASGDGLTKIFIAVSDPAIWRTCDTILMRELTLPGRKGESTLDATGSFKDDVMFYIESKSGNTLALIPINGIKGKGANSSKRVVPSFTPSTQLIRMGQAKSELAITTEPFALYPELYWQYCQNFMAQIEESTFHKITKKDINWGFNQFEITNVLSMKMEMELSMLFGQDGEYQIGNDRTYFTRGITRDIEKVLTYGSGSSDLTVTKENYNTWLKEVFDGNNGSENRVLFAGSGLLKSIAQVDEFQKQMGVNENRRAQLGIEVRSIVTNFGSLDIVHAPLFRECGWENNGIVLDLEHINKHEFVPMTVTNLDLKTSGQKNADARVLQEVSALTLRYPDCHAIIKPKA